jgi:integrase
MPKSITGSVFPMNGFTASKAFDVAVKRAGLKDLRFHDLRHTGITHLAEKLPNLIELASVSGHRSLKMLQRYYHPKAEDLAKKLG